MNRAELVFKAIDVLAEKPQNAVRYPRIVRVQNIAYHTASEEYNVADLYFRRDIFDDGKKHPILLYVHGGGFIKGDKDYRITNSEFYDRRHLQLSGCCQLYLFRWKGGLRPRI